MLYNVYCDETCHLEHDGINVMVLGAIWCPQNKLKEINQRIRQIKVCMQANNFLYDIVNFLDKILNFCYINNSSSAMCRRSS